MADASWFKKAVVYQILIDRFAGCRRDGWDRPEFLGGSIRGIIGHLDYIDQLGANTLWISPFYKCSEYHGYHITDFFEVDPRFGTLDDLKELIKSAQAKGLRIIADFVPNHCSSQHHFFTEARKDRKSEFTKWFYFKKWPDQYLSFLSVKDLPKLNLDYEPARQYIITAAKYWLSMGLDGFRLDHIIGPGRKFWKAFREEVKREFPSAVLIGETWMSGIKFKDLKTLRIRNKYKKFLGKKSDDVLAEYAGLLDGVLDFTFQELARRFIAEPETFDAGKFAAELKKHYSGFPEGFILATFLDNHDMDRFLFQCKNRKERLKIAAESQFSIDQPAIIYYGTETGMTQEKSASDPPMYGDLQARQPMNWDSMDGELLEFYKKIIKEKKERR